MLPISTPPSPMPRSSPLGEGGHAQAAPFGCQAVDHPRPEPGLGQADAHGVHTHAQVEGLDIPGKSKHELGEQGQNKTRDDDCGAAVAVTQARAEHAGRHQHERVARIQIAGVVQTEGSGVQGQKGRIRT